MMKSFSNRYFDSKQDSFWSEKNTRHTLFHVVQKINLNSIFAQETKYQSSHYS